MSGGAHAGAPAAEVRTPCGRVSLDPATGNLPELAFTVEAREISPLHSAAWVDEPGAETAHLPPVEAELRGDFLRAPFGASDVEEAPPHGWTANSSWRVEDAPADTLCATLDRLVQGATIAKRLTLSPDAPLLYQTHLIEGGSGPLTVAHRPMIHCAAGGRLYYSPKRLAVTPDVALEPGRGALTYPAEGPPDAFPGPDGPVDLTRLPIAGGSQDFVTLIEADASPLVWTAILRDAEDDIVIVIVLKDPRVLPVTMLWHSNGGRDRAPWNGRHTGVIGVEDAIAAGPDGQATAMRANALTRLGVPTALALAKGRAHRVAHVIGAVPRDGWGVVADIRVDGATLVLASGTGARRTLPFDRHFFEETA